VSVDVATVKPTAKTQQKTSRKPDNTRRNTRRDSGKKEPISPDLDQDEPISTLDTSESRSNGDHFGLEGALKRLQQDYENLVDEFEIQKRDQNAQIESLEREIKSYKSSNQHSNGKGKESMKDTDSYHNMAMKDLQTEVSDLKKLFVQENAGISRKICGTENSITTLSNEIHGIRARVETLELKMVVHFDKYLNNKEE
jgi:hypothetical protein